MEFRGNFGAEDEARLTPCKDDKPKFTEITLFKAWFGYLLSPYGKNNGCKGCIASNGCPFGKSCFIFRYIKMSGEYNYTAFKKQLIEEFNGLSIPGMPEIDALYAMNGAYVNLAYPMPNGKSVKLLDDKEVYLCNQVHCEFNDGELVRCFGLVAGMDFLLVAEYGENGSNPELVVYKKR